MSNPRNPNPDGSIPNHLGIDAGNGREENPDINFTPNPPIMGSTPQDPFCLPITEGYAKIINHRFEKNILPMLKKRASFNQKKAYRVKTTVLLNVMRHFLNEEQGDTMFYLPVRWIDQKSTNLGRRLNKFDDQLYLLFCTGVNENQVKGIADLLKHGQFFAICGTHRIVPVPNDEVQKMVMRYQKDIKPYLPNKNKTDYMYNNKWRIQYFLDDLNRYESLPDTIKLKWAETKKIKNYDAYAQAMSEMDEKYKEHMKNNATIDSLEDEGKNRENDVLTFLFEIETEDANGLIIFDHRDLTHVCPPNCLP